MTAQYDAQKACVDVAEDGKPVLRYWHGSSPVPPGGDAALQRGDYVHPLYGLDGEVLTDDWPADHPHHRGINWSWATIKWNGETRDAFAVRGIWARPSGDPHTTADDGCAVIEADQRWMWDDKTDIVHEHVVIRAFAAGGGRRMVDFEIVLTPVVDGLEFCGRLEAGYSGFNVRMAPGKGQQIQLHNDAPGASPRAAFGDYSAEFKNAPGRAGLAILQNEKNPMYPSDWREYPPLNFFQPAFPGGSLIPMPKEKPIALRYRLCVHQGALDGKAIEGLWAQYNNGGNAKDKKEGAR
jgi:hypothetical protein